MFVATRYFVQKFFDTLVIFFFYSFIILKICKISTLIFKNKVIIKKLQINSNCSNFNFKKYSQLPINNNSSSNSSKLKISRLLLKPKILIPLNNNSNNYNLKKNLCLVYKIGQFLIMKLIKIKKIQVKLLKNLQL